jgi:transposase
MRAKLSLLEEAFTGHFSDQHAFLLAKMLARVDALDADLAELDAKLQELIAGFAGAVERLDEIPGVGQTAAHLLPAELGADMTRFQPPGTWSPGPGSPPASASPPATPRATDPPGTATPTWLACSARSPSPPARPIPSLVNATGGSPVDAASNERSSRSAGPFWSSSGICCPTQRPGSTTSAPACYDTRIGPERARRNHVRQLEALGYKVTLDPAA